MPTVDADLAIAQVLQRDGRAGNAALGRAAGLSANAAAARLARLLETRELSIVTLVRPAVGSSPLLAHVSVHVTGAVLPVGLEAARLGTVSFASLTAGHHPLVLELRCRDGDQLRDQLDRLRRLRGVAGIDVVLADDVVRDAYRTATIGDDEPFDEVDDRIVAALRDDGRASFVRLADACGLSPAATRVRVLRRIRSGAIHVTALLAHGRMQSMTRLGVGIHVAGQTAGAVARGLLGLPGVVFVMTGIGRFDVVAGIDASGDDGADSCLDDIRRLRGVQSLESWRHHDVLRERYE